MPEPEPALRALLDERWPGFKPFVERAARDLVDPKGLSFRSSFASVPRRLGDARALPLDAPPDLVGARPHLTLTDYVRLFLHEVLMAGCHCFVVDVSYSN